MYMLSDIYFFQYMRSQVYVLDDVRVERESHNPRQGSSSEARQRAEAAEDAARRRKNLAEMAGLHPPQPPKPALSLCCVVLVDAVVYY